MSEVAHSCRQNKHHFEKVMLHLIWENPDRIDGGMGVAAHALCGALSHYSGINVQVMTPDLSEVANTIDKNNYQLDIDYHAALLLQDRIEHQQSLEGMRVSMAEFAEEVKFSCLNKFERGGCSTVHAHDWMTAAAGVCVQRLLRVPLVLHVHSTQLDREGVHSRGAVFQHEKWAMNKADVIIAVSDYTKRVITELYDIFPEKIHVIRNAVKEDASVKILSRTNAFKKEPIVMFAGRLVGQKHPEAAVEIISGALKKVPAAKGVIVGGGDKLAMLRELVKFKKMDDRIEVLGHVPQKNMRAIYDSASVLIMPSVSEPFGLVAIEAASAGVAVIMSDRCGASELLKSACIIDLHQSQQWIDCLVKLLQNDELRERQVLQQWREIDGYAWSDAAAKLTDIVGELADSNLTS